MLTPKISGIFDCRKYDQTGKKTHDQREWLSDSDVVTFSALIQIADVPECLMINGQLDEFASYKVSKRERAAAEAEGREPVADCVVAKFKIGSRTAWFDKYGKPTDRPTNEELEKNRYMVQIDFSRKEKDPSQPLKASGYWVNNIMFTVVERNPFEGQAFEVEPEPEIEPEPSDNLPFN
jgi:hypothetical protein